MSLFRGIIAQSQGAGVGGGGGSWEVAFYDATGPSQTSSTSHRTFRNLIPAALIPAGTKIRFQLDQVSTVIARMFVGFKAASGDAYDFASSPTQVFFGGNPGFDLSSATVVTDEITFPQDGSVDLVVSIEKTSGSKIQEYDASGGQCWSKVDGGIDGATVDATGYALRGGVESQYIRKMEVFVPG